MRLEKSKGKEKSVSLYKTRSQLKMPLLKGVIKKRRPVLKYLTKLKTTKVKSHFKYFLDLSF